MATPPPILPATPAQTKNYSEYLNRLAGLIGMPLSSMTSDETGFLNAYFNQNIKTAWESNNWVDVCPYGEARFVGNLLYFGNDQSQTIYWSQSGVTADNNSIRNPVDGLQTATQLLEDSTTGDHVVTQSGLDTIPSTDYTISIYARAIAGRYLILKYNDSRKYYASFNLVSGTVSTATIASNGTNYATGASITPVGGGFYLCQISFTSSSTADSGFFIANLSSDGTTYSYAGNGASGLYLWGACVQQTSSVTPNGATLPYYRIGEPTIDALYDVFASSPLANNSPVRFGYQPVRTGVQLIGSSTWNNQYLLNGNNTITTTIGAPVGNPVYLYYRSPCLSYYGSAYSSTATYAVGDIVQFTDSASVINYYTCLVATSAGQSPSTTPASWGINFIPDVFFQYCVYKGYADWLRTDGQFEKSVVAEKMAEDALEGERDKQEREQGFILPLKVATHVTSRT